MTRTATDANWLTAREIADLRLAGLPTTTQGVIKRAVAEGWPAQDRAGKGGGRVFNALALPDAARDDFVARQVDALAALERRRGRPQGSAYFDRNPDVADAVEALIAEQRHPVRTVLKLLAAFNFAELPKPKTLQRFMRDLEQRKKVLFTALRDPDAYKSSYRMSLGRMDATVTHAHEMWEIDTTKADVLCTDGRWSVLGIIDRWSRRARFLVVPSESAQSVRRMLVTTISAWGVMPEVLKVDNGSGFINASVESALELLGIQLDPCLPGTPEDKPHIERLFGTFMRERASLLPGFSGHNVAQAQKLRAKAKKKTGRAEIVPGITGAQLQTVLDAWVDGEYHQRTHSSLKMSPMERWQRSPQPARTAPGERELKLALSAYIGPAKVSKRGLRWKGGRYWSSCLVSWLGKDVYLRRDEDDLGALFVFDGEWNYIDTAVDQARSGMTEQQFAMVARNQVDAHIKAERAVLKIKQRNFGIDEAKQYLLRNEAEAAGKLAHFPKPTVDHVTPAMASITATPASPVDQARLDEVLRRTEPVAGAPLTVDQKVAQADAVIIAHRRGELVDAEALRRADLYKTTSEYRAHKMVFTDFQPASTGQTAQHGVA